MSASTVVRSEATHHLFACRASDLAYDALWAAEEALRRAKLAYQEQPSVTNLSEWARLSELWRIASIRAGLADRKEGETWSNYINVARRCHRAS